MDPLDDVLAGIRVRGSMVGRSMLRPPWALAIEGDTPFKLVAMIAGTGWVWSGDREPVPMEEGAIAVAVGGDPIVAAHARGAPPSVVITDADTCHEPRSGASLVDRDRFAVRAWGDPEAPVSVLAAGYHSAGQRFTTLAADLPELLMVSGDPVVRSALLAAAEETVGCRPGQQTVFDRLMELLLFATVRVWTASDAHAPSWYRAIADPLVGPVLRAIHQDPSRRWTVADLAAVAVQSRSAFARRFRDLVGEPPMSYLTRWRLACGADLLAEGAAVEAAARATGYTDPFAFSTAFRRRYGHAPSRHRRGHHT